MSTTCRSCRTSCTVIAIVANSILPGANYLYVARPEDTASILDFLPKNYVVRLILMALVITLLFFLIYLPWLIKDIKVKKLSLATNTITNDIESIQKQPEENAETKKENDSKKVIQKTNN
jgi:hypothetical protein